jgi:hypothetical protein
MTDRLDVARAWRRALLGDDDKLHEDGKLIMADLERAAGSSSPRAARAGRAATAGHPPTCQPGRRPTPTS